MSERKEWQRVYAEEGTPWDMGMATPALGEVLGWAREAGLSEGARIVVPCCGLGHDAAELARQGYRVSALDIVPEAIAEARERHGAAVDWRCADWFDPAEARFQACFDHTAFVAFPPERRSSFAEACARHLEPGGLWFGVFFHTVREPDQRPWAVQAAELRGVAEVAGFQVLRIGNLSQGHPRRLGRELGMLARRRQ